MHRRYSQPQMRAAAGPTRITGLRLVLATIAGPSARGPLAPAVRAFLKRTTGLEPATFGLGSRRSTN